MPTIITVAPTGPIATKADNPTLPTRPEEIADEVLHAYEAGASVAHLHFRDEQGRPTADLTVARRVIDLISQRCDILIQLSTGVGLTVPFEDRARLVDLRPQMATLNPCTMSFGDAVFLNPPRAVRELAARMRDLGVKPELEIYDTGHLESVLRLRDEGLIDTDPLQFSIVLGVRGGMAATPENLITMVNRLPERRGLAGDRDRPRQPRPDGDGARARRQRPRRDGGHAHARQGRPRTWQPGAGGTRRPARLRAGA